MNMTKLILSVYLSAKLWFSAQSTFTLSLNQAKKFILEYQRLLPSKSLLMQLFMDLLDTWLKTTVISSRSLYVLSIMMLTINSILKVSFQTEHSSSVKAWKWHCCLHTDSFLGFQTNIIIICYQGGLRVTLHLLFYLSNQSIKSSLTSWPSSSSSSSSSSGQELSNSQNISTRFSQQCHELVLWHCPNNEIVWRLPQQMLNMFTP